VERAHEQQSRELAGARPRAAASRPPFGDGAELLLEGHEQLEPALGQLGGAPGARVEPGSAATASQNFGLYFMVHEPAVGAEVYRELA